LGILGSSLGGLISCYAAWTRPTIFAKAGCMSSSFWWNNEDFLNEIIKQNNQFLSNTNKEKPIIYLDSGDTGEDLDGKYET